MSRDFNKDWRRKQEIKMRPIADAIYKNVFGNDVIVERYEQPDNKVLDIVFAIDVKLTFVNGQILTGQEKFLSHNYAKFRSITVEHYQNPLVEELGDWFKLASQIYFVGYCDATMGGFEPWVIADWTKVVTNTNDGNITWSNNTNSKDGARASFVYTKMDDLPNDCIIASSWT